MLFWRKEQTTAAPLQDSTTPEAVAVDTLLSAKASTTSETIDIIEADLLAVIGRITQSAGAAHAAATKTAEDLGGVRTGMEKLRVEGEGAALNAKALAATSVEVSSIASTVANSIDAASTRIVGIAADARANHELLDSFASASREIGAIAETITAVAAQTKLLALNATIEAVQAGSSARGFSVIASEIKDLSLKTAELASDIRARITRLRESSTASIGATERILDEIKEVEPLIQEVKVAMSGATQAVVDLSKRATDTSSFVSQVSEQASRVDAAAKDSIGYAEETRAVSSQVSERIAALGRRFVTVIRLTELGDRRRHDRYPVEWPARLRFPDGDVASQTIDLSRGGLLLAPVERKLAAGQRVEAKVEFIGEIGFRIAGVSGLGIHCVFDRLNKAAAANVDILLARLRDEYQPMIRFAEAVAASIVKEYELAVEDGRLTREALFDTDYQHVPETDPPQYNTRSIAVLEEILPPIIEGSVVANPKMLACNVVDRNGWMPVHHREFAQPQRKGEREWNNSFSRNKRIFDDRNRIATARSTRPFLIQNFLRDMGGNAMMTRTVDVPIRAFGRHWGGLRTVYRL